MDTTVQPPRPSRMHTRPHSLTCARASTHAIAHGARPDTMRRRAACPAVPLPLSPLPLSALPLSLLPLSLLPLSLLPLSLLPLTPAAAQAKLWDCAAGGRCVLTLAEHTAPIYAVGAPPLPSLLPLSPLPLSPLPLSLLPTYTCCGARLRRRCAAAILTPAVRGINRAARTRAVSCEDLCRARCGAARWPRRWARAGRVRVWRFRTDRSSRSAPPRSAAAILANEVVTASDDKTVKTVRALRSCRVGAAARAA
jgi:hypothetical protein